MFINHTFVCTWGTNIVRMKGRGSWDIHSVTGGGGNDDKDDSVTEVSKYFKGPIGP